MNITQLTALCALLNLGVPDSHFEKVTGGLIHTMWHVKTPSGHYAIKELNRDIIFRPGVWQEYELSEKIAREFASRGIPAVVSLTKDGASLQAIEQDVFIVYPWVDAINTSLLPRDKAYKSLALKIASILADMHGMQIDKVGIKPFNLERRADHIYRDLIDGILVVDFCLGAHIYEHRSLILQANYEYGNAIPLLAKNVVLSHGDLDPKNVLCNAEMDPFLIDWESVRLLNPIQEIVMVALDWSGLLSHNGDQDLFAAMLSCYEEKRGTLSYEQKQIALKGILDVWLNWFVYNMQRFVDTLSQNSMIQLENNEHRVAGEQVELALNTIKQLMVLVESGI